MWISKDLKLVKKIQGLQRPPWAQDTNWLEKPNLQPRWDMQPFPQDKPPAMPRLQQPVSPFEPPQLPPVIPDYEPPPEVVPEPSVYPTFERPQLPPPQPTFSEFIKPLGVMSDYGELFSRIATSPFQPEVLPKYRPPTEEEKKRGIHMYQPTGEGKVGYEKLKEGVSAKLPLTEKIPWLDERGWRISPFTLLEEVPNLGLWMTGAGASKKTGELIENAVKIAQKSAAGKSITSAERKVLQKASEVMKKEQGFVKLPEAKVIERARTIAEDILGIPLRRGGIPRPTPPPSPAVQKVTQLIREARPVRAEQKILRTEELGRRVSEAEKLAEGVPAIEKAAISTRALKGQLPTAEFAPVAEQVSRGEMDDLFRMIWDSDSMYFDKLNTDTALKKVLMEGKLPTEGEDKLLSRFFGEEFVSALRSKRGLGRKAREVILDALNIPRAVLASWDMSAPGRQGLLLLIGRPKRSLPAFLPMVKAHFSEKSALLIDEGIRLRPNFARAESAGLFHAPIERGAGVLTRREETFMSKFAEYIPGVRMSERSFLTYLNKLRADVFDDVITKWERNGVKTTIALEKKLANYLNEATGRGSLGKRLDDLNDITSAIFFSPRLQAARVKVGVNLFKEPLIAQEALRDIVGTVGTVSGLVSLAGLAGASIESDPRSSDFGKIRVGNTRLDPWGGFQQYARLIAMLWSGQRKTSTTGEVVESNRLETLLRFGRTKLAPGAGAVTDILDNQTFIGDAVYGEDADVKKQLYNRLTPLFIQDLIDSLEQEGFPRGLIALPGFFGTGVVSFKSVAGAVLPEGIGWKDFSQTQGIKSPVTDWRQYSKAGAK